MFIDGGRGGSAVQVISKYMMSSRSAWVIGDPVSKKTKTKQAKYGVAHL